MPTLGRIFFVLLLVFNLVIWIQAREYLYYEEVDKYYKFHRKPLKWWDAIEACNEVGATLALPQSEAELQVLKTIFRAYPSQILSGVPAPDRTLLAFHDHFQEGEYLCLDGNSLQLDSAKWAHGEPNGGAGENCGAMVRAGELIDHACSTPSTYICEKPGFNATNVRKPDPRCPTDDVDYKYIKKMDKCVKIHSNPKVWGVARQICQAEGGDLMVLRNVHDEAYLKAYLQNWLGRLNHLHYRDTILVGFHDQFRDQEYITVKGEPLSQTGFLSWKPGSPNGGQGEGCGSLWKDGGLDDVNCQLSMIFACELNME